MQVVIIDYGSGNLRSAAKAFERARAHVTVSSTVADLKNASHIVLPGVGAFADCMRGLAALPGMLETLEEQVRGKKKPFFGICVGMQMMMQRGFEHGEHKGLGWLEGDVVPLTGSGRAEHGATGYKVPHMGWNDLQLLQPAHPALAGIRTGDHAYFVHSYHAQCKNKADVLATAEYGAPITALIGRGNMLGAQFHPEKSQHAGLKLIANFLKM